MNRLIVLTVSLAMIGSAMGSGVTIGLHPELHPIHSLYHSQSLRGQYSYGYVTPMITRNEVRSSDGMTRGGYSYMDTNGVIQTVQYTSDPIHGFQVAATNLPQDLPDVAEAKARHLALFQTIQANHAHPNPQVVLPQPVQDLPEVIAARQAHLAAIESAKAGIMPQPVQDTPEVVKARSEHLAIIEATRARDESLRRFHSVYLSPVARDNSGTVVPAISQNAAPETPGTPVLYRPAIEQSQSGSNGDLGLYSYGYVGPLSSQMESKSSDGVTRGGYSYIDANGILQTVRYIADDINGFRVQASNQLSTQEIQNIQTPIQNQIVNSSPDPTATITSNRGGFLINTDNSLNSIEDQKDVLYKQEIQY